MEITKLTRLKVGDTLVFGQTNSKEIVAIELDTGEIWVNYTQSGLDDDRNGNGTQTLSGFKYWVESAVKEGEMVRLFRVEDGI